MLSIKWDEPPNKKEKDVHHNRIDDPASLNRKNKPLIG